MIVGSDEWWMKKLEEQRNESWRLGLQTGFSLAAIIFGVLFNLDKFI